MRSLLLASIMLPSAPAIAQDRDDVVVMRRAVAPARLDEAPSRQHGVWDPQAWRYADAAPACTDHAVRVRDVPCKVLGALAPVAKCTEAKPDETDDSEGRYDGCVHDWKLSATGNWSSTCSDTATRDETYRCVRQGGDATPVPADVALCPGSDPSGVSEPTSVVTNCSYRWVYTPYSNWSSSCSNSAVKTRTATCTRSDGNPATDKTVDNRECNIRNIAQESLEIGPQRITTDCTGMLQNGGFEQFAANWTFSGAALNASNDPNNSATAIRTGARSAYMGPQQGHYVQQTIPTVKGASYTVTSWVWQYGIGYVTTVVNGSVISGTALGNGGNGKWYQRTGTFVATGTSTTIRFGHGNSYTGYMYLDDVIVAQTPTG